MPNKRTLIPGSRMTIRMTTASVLLGLLLWPPFSEAMQRFSTLGERFSSPEAGLAYANQQSRCSSNCVFFNSAPTNWGPGTNSRLRRDWNYRHLGSTSIMSGVTEWMCPEGRVPSQLSVSENYLLQCVIAACPEGTERNEYGICIPIEPGPSPLPINPDANSRKQGGACPS
jgi:hypothetical protein